jgi:hypothetical protein
MPTPVFGAELRAGKLVFDRPEELKSYLLGKCKPGRYEVVIRRKAKPKSGNARRYLHGVVVKIFADETGRTIAEMKALLKLKLLWDGETVDKFGLPVVPSTEDLDAQQYAEFTDHCRRLAAECNISIPGPNEIE